MSANPQSSEKPLLFISHKHSDKKIADVIRSFVSLYSGGRVEVFQTSSSEGKTATPGAVVKKELIKNLTRANVVILVYTAANENWNFCMWECGVASYPHTPEGADTKTILLRCGADTPALFLETVNIHGRDPVHIQTLTNMLLTNPDLFPGLGRAVTDFHSDGPEVAGAAADLYQKLLPVLPPEKEDPSIEWPASPFLQFEIGFGDVDSIKKIGPKNRPEASGVIQEKCIIRSADKYAEQLFGVPSFPSDMSFKQLADSWRENYPDSQSKWIEALSGQMMDGAMWRFPKPAWNLMQGLNDDCWYAPVLNRVRKIPVQQAMQFDVYFYKFDVDPDKQSVDINIPTDTPEK
jgi:hypothetical protein